MPFGMKEERNKAPYLIVRNGWFQKAAPCPPDHVNCAF